MEYEEYKELSHKLDTKLMGQFVWESMTKDLGYIPSSKISEIGNIALMQKQYVHFCLQSKANITIDNVQKNQDTVVITALKEHMCMYLSDTRNKNNKAMKYLYELDDTKMLCQQISMLALHSIYKRVNSIMSVPKEQQRESLDPQNVCTAISLYVYFTLLANNNYTEKDYNELFVEAWFNYYEHWMARQLMLKMKGEHWKDDFDGVLLAD